MKRVYNLKENERIITREGEYQVSCKTSSGYKVAEVLLDDLGCETLDDPKIWSDKDMRDALHDQHGGTWDIIIYAGEVR